MLKSPAKAFVKFHAYSTEAGDGSRDDAVETFLSRLEDKAAPILRRILDAASHGGLTSLSKSEWDVVNEFTVAQAKRSPDSFTKRPRGFDMNAYYTGLLARFEQDVRPFTEEERAYFYSDVLTDRLTRNAQVEATLGMGEELAEAMRYVGLFVMRTTHRNRAFIVGSNPVAKMTLPGDTMIGSPNVELWLPLSSQVALARCGPPTYEYRDLNDQRWFRNINTAVAKQSTIVAGRAEALVKSVSAA